MEHNVLVYGHMPAAVHCGGMISKLAQCAEPDRVPDCAVLGHAASRALVKTRRCNAVVVLATIARPPVRTFVSALCGRIVHGLDKRAAQQYA